MHWNTVSKQCRCCAIMTSFSGMNEKFRIIFEAATAHCCFSVRPSSSRLNKPSSSNHQSEERDLDIFFSTAASVTEEQDPRLPYERYPTIRFQLIQVNFNILIAENYIYAELTQNAGECHLSLTLHTHSQILLQGNLHLAF
jgi:hypothetical protein